MGSGSKNNKKHTGITARESVPPGYLDFIFFLEEFTIPLIIGLYWSLEMKKRWYETINWFCLQLQQVKNFSFIFSWTNNTAISIDTYFDEILQIHGGNYLENISQLLMIMVMVMVVYDIVYHYPGHSD